MKLFLVGYTVKLPNYPIQSLEKCIRWISKWINSGKAIVFLDLNKRSELTLVNVRWNPSEECRGAKWEDQSKWKEGIQEVGVFIKTEEINSLWGDTKIKSQKSEFLSEHTRSSLGTARTSTDEEVMQKKLKTIYYQSSDAVRSDLFQRINFNKIIFSTSPLIEQPSLKLCENQHCELWRPKL